MDRIVIIPTYNEKENVEAIIRAVMVLPQPLHVLIIDDGSPDGTADIVKDLQQEFTGQLFLEERRGKLGLGTAYIHGFKWCLEKGYRFICEMDADFSHSPTDLLRLCGACDPGGADVAVGSRYVKGGKVENWPRDRIFLSKGGALYTRIITLIPVKDSTAGFVCYRREVLEAINFDAINFVGYAFQIEMKFAAWKLGFKITEVPITFIDRQLGNSKMNKGIIKEGIVGVLKLKWQSMFKNYSNKVKNVADTPNSVYPERI